jgi:hypothetical protein
VGSLASLPLPRYVSGGTARVIESDAQPALPFSADGAQRLNRPIGEMPSITSSVDAPC